MLKLFIQQDVWGHISHKNFKLGKCIMVNIENARPTRKQLLGHIERFESFCMGQEKYTPSHYREVNEELSISAVLMLGKIKYHKDMNGKRLIWKGLDQKDYDLGYTHDAKVMRDYPGFHRRSAQALGSNEIKEVLLVPKASGKGNVSKVILQDGTEGIGPDHRIALRNAVLKRHVIKQFNHSSLSEMWKRVWGTA